MVFFEEDVVMLFLGSRGRSRYLIEDGCANNSTINFPLFLSVVVVVSEIM